MQDTSGTLPPRKGPGKKDRVQLKYLQFDYDFFHKPKIIAIRFKFGANGVVALMDCLCKMAKGTDAEIPTDCARALCVEYDLPDPDVFINYCLSLKVFEPGSSDLYITNSRVAEDQENVAYKQEEWRTKKRQQRDNSGTSAGSVNTEDLNVLDNKKNGVDWLQRRSEPDSLKEAVRRWRQKLIKNHHCDYDEIQFEAHLANYHGDLEKFEADVNHTAGGGWKTLQQAPMDEQKRIEIAVTAKAQATAEPQRPKPKPIPKEEPLEPSTPESSAAVVEARKKISQLVKKVIPGHATSRASPVRGATASETLTAVAEKENSSAPPIFPKVRA